MNTSTTVAFSLWELAAIALVLAGAFTGLGKLLLLQFERHLEQRFNELKLQAEQVRTLERNFLELKAELPEKYLRREDYIRGQTVIEAKLDAISSEVKILQIRGGET